MSDYTYPNELIKKTESRIQSQVKGNGVEPADFKISVKRQGIDIFHAETRFDFDVDVQTKQVSGQKTDGRQVAQGQMDHEIRQYINGLTAGQSGYNIAKDIIQKLPNKGLGADKQVIPLIAQKNIFCEHVACQPCQGKGNSRCHTCGGKGQSPCQLCRGRGTMPCIQCRGVGTIQSGGERITCRTCQGRREQYCTQCRGQKLTSCANCNAKGQISCRSCGGQGAQTNIVTVTPLLKTSSHIHLTDLNEDPKRMVARIGADNLSRGEHIKTSIVKSIINDETEHNSNENDHPQNAIYYRNEIQWAVSGLNYGEKIHDITFAGSKGAVCESGNFMDQVFEKPLSLLSKAAQGDGFVAGLLKDANEYRVSRETLSLIANSNKKKAHAQLAKSYRLGVTPNTLKSFVMNGYQALKTVTKRPRYIGLAIGLLISAIINYVWFIVGERGVTTIYDLPIRYGIDAVVLLVSIMETILSIKVVGYIIFRSLMRDLAIAKYKMPPLGKAGFYAVIGCIALWGGFFATLFL